MRTISSQLIELADTSHQAPGSGHGGQFAPKGGMSGGAAAAKPGKNPKQQQQLKQAAVLTAEAKNCQQQAATINTQIQALSALIEQDTYSLSTGQSTSNAQSTASNTTGTGKTTSSTATAGSTAATTASGTSATSTGPSTAQQLQSNITQITSLRQQRDAFISKANLYTQQAATLTQLAA